MSLDLAILCRIATCWKEIRGAVRIGLCEAKAYPLNLLNPLNPLNLLNPLNPGRPAAP